MHTVQELKEIVLAGLDDTYDLVYVDRGDRLTDEQVEALVAREDDPLESTDEWVGEQSWVGACDQADDDAESQIAAWALTDDFDADDLRVAWQVSDERGEVIDEIRGRESGDWYKQLLSNTPRVFTRSILAEEFDGEDSTGNTPLDFLDAVALPNTFDNIEAAAELMANAQTTGPVYIMANLDLEAMLAVNDDDTLVFTDPFLLLSCPYQGNGWESQFTGQVRIKGSALRTDEGQIGHSWMTIAGVDKSYYDTEFEVIPATKSEEAAA